MICQPSPSLEAEKKPSDWFFKTKWTVLTIIITLQVTLCRLSGHIYILRNINDKKKGMNLRAREVNGRGWKEERKGRKVYNYILI